MSFPSALPIQHRSGAISAPGTGDNFQVIWSTFAAVRRVDWEDGEFDEILDPKGCDLTRLASGAAPVLDSHQSGAVSGVIGVVKRAWITGSRGMAEIVLSSRPEVAGIRHDVASGILRNLSVGYAIHEIERENRRGRSPLLHIRKWEPLELSIVAVPADAGAQVQRNSDSRSFPVRIRTLRPPTVGELEKRLFKQVANCGRV